MGKQHEPARSASPGVASTQASTGGQTTAQGAAMKSNRWGNAAAQEALKEKGMRETGESVGSLVGGAVGGFLGGAIGGYLGGLAGDLLEDVLLSGSAMGATKSTTPPDPAKVKELQTLIDEAKALDAEAAKLETEATALDTAGDSVGASSKRTEAATKKGEAAKKKDAAIQLAAKVYSVDISKLKSIAYDAGTSGEAVTSSTGGVKVGDEAFRDAAWLGSSIGHEAEIHWNEQGAKGNWYTGPIGTALQEVQAYDYEIANAGRYGTTPANLKDLEARRKGYYDQMTKEYQDRADKGIYTMKPGEEAL